MKHIAPTFIAFTIVLFTGALLAHAQSYTPLAPLPGTVEVSGSTNISTYLSGMIKLLIALGGALSIVMAIIGGTQYIAAGSLPDAKSGAKERIANALVGLALVLTSYLILNSINPKLVQFSFMLPPVGVSPMATTTAAATPTPWPDDSSTRGQLSSLGITFNHDNCTSVGQGKPVSEGGIGGAPCTSVYQLNSTAISALGLLKGNCSGCSVMINGGTEYWLHSATTRHRPGNSVVDINKNTALDAKIHTGTSLGVQTTCSSLGPAYRLSGLGGGLYVDEGNHWHVCY